MLFCLLISFCFIFFFMRYFNGLLRNLNNRCNRSHGKHVLTYMFSFSFFHSSLSSSKSQHLIAAEESSLFGSSQMSFVSSSVSPSTRLGYLQSDVLLYLALELTLSLRWSLPLRVFGCLQGDVLLYHVLEPMRTLGSQGLY